MARRAGLRACTTPGCGELTTGGKCAGCVKASDARRGTRTARGYDNAWLRTRARYLRTHRWCECEDHQQQPDIMRPRATDVDHIDGLGPKGPRGHDWSNLRALAKACHSRRTAQDQPGGWNDREPY